MRNRVNTFLASRRCTALALVIGSHSLRLQGHPGHWGGHSDGGPVAEAGNPFVMVAFVLAACGIAWCVRAGVVEKGRSRARALGRTAAHFWSRISS